MFKPVRHIAILIAAVAAMLLAGSCGPYSFSPGGRGGLSSLAVPLFENRTAEYGIRELLTEGVIDRFVRDGSLKIVNERLADAVLRGAVVSYESLPYNYDAGEVVSEYRVTVTVQVRVENPVKRNVIWEEEALSQWGTYAAATETEDDGKRRAVEKLAEDIVNRTVKGW